METVTIAGQEYPRHPSNAGQVSDPVRRLSAALESLRFAMLAMTPADRSAYLAIIRAHALVFARLHEARSSRVMTGPESLFAN